MGIKIHFKNKKVRYVLVTYLISALGFFKSFVLLKLFDLTELGILTFSQTLLTSITLLQFGVITGGYRLFSYKSSGVKRGINSTVFIFFLILSLTVLSIALISNLFFDPKIGSVYLFIFLIVALLGLYSNWVICKLLSSDYIKVVNNSQLFASLVSFLLVLSAYWLGIQIVVLSIVLMPIIIILWAYIDQPQLIPRYNFYIFKKYFWKIVALGFIPYLTSAIMLLNSILGRWIINFSFGTSALGKVYLVTLFITLVSILPSAVSSLFFPKIIASYEKKKSLDLSKSLNEYHLILLTYYLIVFIVTISLMNILVESFFNDHINSISFIYAVLPSLFFLHLSSPSITLFNAMKKFNYILYGSILLIVSYFFGIIFYRYFFHLRIVDFFIIESASSFLFFLFNIYLFFRLKKQLI